MKFTAAVLAIGVVSAADAAPAACTITKVEVFKDDKCQEADADATKKIDAAALKTFNDKVPKVDGKCNEVEKEGVKSYTKVICDGTGYGVKKFTDAKCEKLDEAKDAQAGFVAWDACFNKMKFTDAKYISAGLVADRKRHV